MARGTNDRGREAKQDLPSIILTSCPIRLSFPHLFDPEKNDQGADVWECEALVEPTKRGDAFLDELDAALVKVMTDHFGPEDQWPRGKNDYAPKDKIKNLDPNKLPGAGVTEKWSKFTARSYSPVGIVDADCNEVLNKREVYGGRWARLQLTITVYDNKSKGPTIYLNHVQLLENDESFGGRGSAAAAFGKYDGPGNGSGRRDDGAGSRDREGSDPRGDGGRGDGVRSRDRDTGPGEDRPARGGDSREGRENVDRSGDRRGGRRDDEQAPRGRERDGDAPRGDRAQDRDGGRDRRGGDERDSRDGGRRSDRDDDRRGGGRDDDRRERGGRDDRDRDRQDDRDRRDDRDREDDRRPSRDREDESRSTREDRDRWN